MSDDMIADVRRTASALRMALAAGYAPLTPTDDEALRIWRMLKFSSEGEGNHIDKVPLEVVYRAMLAFPDELQRVNRMGHDKREESVQ